MYFKESDRIANKEQFPRSDIKKIDEFLAQEYSTQIKLHDISDCTSIQYNLQAIVDEYVSFKVLKPRRKYFCPEHEHTGLKLVGRIKARQKAFCYTCNKTYDLDELDFETIYIRVRQPLKWSDDNCTSVAEKSGKPQRPFWTQLQWLVEKLVIPVIIAIIATIVAIALNNYFASPSATEDGTVQSRRTTTAKQSIHLPSPTYVQESLSDTENPARTPIPSSQSTGLSASQVSISPVPGATS